MEQTLGNGSNVSRSAGEVVVLCWALGETLIWTCAGGTGLAAWAWFPGRKGGELEGKGVEGEEAAARSELMLKRFHAADGCSVPIGLVVSSTSLLVSFSSPVEAEEVRGWAALEEVCVS